MAHTEKTRPDDYRSQPDERVPCPTIRSNDVHHRGFSNTPFVSMDDLFAGHSGDYRPSEADWGDGVGGEVLA
jgi:hypothetical protein